MAAGTNILSSFVPIYGTEVFGAAPTAPRPPRLSGLGSARCAAVKTLSRLRLAPLAAEAYPVGTASVALVDE